MPKTWRFLFKLLHRTTRFVTLFSQALGRLDLWPHGREASRIISVVCICADWFPPFYLKAEPKNRSCHDSLFSKKYEPRMPELEVFMQSLV